MLSLKSQTHKQVLEVTHVLHYSMPKSDQKNELPPKHYFSAKHLFERKDSTFHKLCVFCSVVSLSWKSILHTCTPPNAYFIYMHFYFRDRKTETIEETEKTITFR